MIAGERQVRVRGLQLLAGRHEAEGFPEALRGGEVGDREAHLREVPAQRRFGRAAIDGGVGARLEHGDCLSEGSLKPISLKTSSPVRHTVSSMPASAKAGALWATPARTKVSTGEGPPRWCSPMKSRPSVSTP